MTDRKEVELLAGVLIQMGIRVKLNHDAEGRIDSVTVTTDEQERTMDPLTFAEGFRPLCAVRLIFAA